MGGRGSSSTRAGGTLPTQQEGRGASFRTAELVNEAINAKADDDRADVRKALADISAGQKISTYSAEINRTTYDEVQGAANDITVWEKMDDGTWRSDNGRRIENNELARRFYNDAYAAKIAPGEITTESRFKITGRGSRDYDGVSVTSGTYDTIVTGARVGNNGPRKVMETGNIATYNGTQYGMTMRGGEWVVTHIPTGLSLGETKAKTVTQAAAFIKRMDARVKGTPGLDDAANRFAKTIRYD